MTDDGRGRSSVNLEELERQLREASRSRIRAAASDPVLRGTDAESPSIPDLAALTRQFGARPANAQQPIPQQTTTGAWTSPPPSVASVEPRYEAPPLSPNSWDMIQSQAPSVGSEHSEPVGYYGSAPSPSTMEPVHSPPFEARSSSFSAAPAGQDGPPTGYTGLVGELPRGFGPPVTDRFPAVEKEKRGSWSAIRAVIIILLVAIGVLAVYFFQSTRYAVTLGPQSDQKQVPVIKPDPTPVKIAPDNKTAESSPAGAELFTKDTPENSATVKKRATAEVPVDVNAIVKDSPVAKSILPSMGDPKAVKTVTVRPDGTIVGDPQIVPAKPSTDSAPQVAQPPKNVAPAAPVIQKVEPVAVASVVPSTALPVKVAKTELPPLVGEPADVPLPSARPSDLDLVAEAPAGADPLAALVKSATENAVPAETAEEGAPAQVTGEYSVQFGAPAVEADANGLAKRVKADFAEQIDGRDVHVIKAESNGKTVYRVRAVGYTRDEANAACNGVTSAGGKCFIARN